MGTLQIVPCQTGECEEGGPQGTRGNMSAKVRMDFVEPVIQKESHKEQDKRETSTNGEMRQWVEHKL